MLLALAAVGLLLYVLRDVLTPIFLAFTIAYVLDPVVDRLERWKLPRALAIALVVTTFFGAVTLFALLVIPDVVRDLVAVAKELPRHAKHWLAQAEPLLERYGVTVPKTAEEWLARLQANTETLSKVPLEPVGDLLKKIVGGTASAVGAVFAALIVPILAIYLLNDFDRIVQGVKELIPPRHRGTVSEIASEVDGTLSQFMRGQLTVMAILAVLYGGAYSALGIRLAIPIGIAAGILNIVPYVGSAFALLAGLLMALIGGGGWFQIGGVVVAYVVVQTLEGFVITPRIVGESVGLREVWVLLALFIAGEVFGFLGVLLAVPAAAVLKIFFQRAVAQYKRSGLFAEPAAALAGGVEARGPGPPLEADLPVLPAEDDDDEHTVAHTPRSKSAPPAAVAPDLEQPNGRGADAPAAEEDTNPGAPSSKRAAKGQSEPAPEASVADPAPDPPEGPEQG